MTATSHSPARTRVNIVYAKRVAPPRFTMQNCSREQSASGGHISPPTAIRARQTKRTNPHWKESDNTMNVNPNKPAITLTSEETAAVSASVASLYTAMPFLVSLTTSEIRQLPKLGDKSESFVRQ